MEHSSGSNPDKNTHEGEPMIIDLSETLMMMSSIQDQKYMPILMSLKMYMQELL